MSHETVLYNSTITDTVIIGKPTSVMSITSILVVPTYSRNALASLTLYIIDDDGVRFYLCKDILILNNESLLLQNNIHVKNTQSIRGFSSSPDSYTILITQSPIS